MEAKPTFNFKQENIDETRIDEILKGRYAPGVFVKVPCAAPLKLTEQQWLKFLKTDHPKKINKKNNEIASARENLSKLIKNKSIPPKMKSIYEQHYKYFMDLHLKKKKPSPKEHGYIKYSQLIQKQVLALIDYVEGIRKCDEEYGNPIPREKVFDLVARIFNAKHSGSMTKQKVRTIYGNREQKK